LSHDFRRDRTFVALGVAGCTGATGAFIRQCLAMLAMSCELEVELPLALADELPVEWHLVV
jgi:hypothetical protein